QKTGSPSFDLTHKEAFVRRRFGRCGLPPSLLFLPLLALGFVLLGEGLAFAQNETQLAIPDLHKGSFQIGGHSITAWNLLFYGALVITGTLGISLFLRHQVRILPAHSSML